MSIKSQKSLNEECSEILEKSYSVRSLSDGSISTDDEEDCLSRELLRKMTPAVLSKLRRRFKREKVKGVGNIDRKVEEVMRAAAMEEGIEFATTSQPNDTLWLHAQDFVAAVDEIFGPHKFTAHARHLCLALDPLRSGRVRWGALLTRLLPSERPPVGQRSPPECKRPLQLRHCQRECIVKLVSIEREGSFCYVAVSKGGKIAVYSGQFKLLNAYEVFHHRPGARRRVKNCWITDAVYMEDAICITYATSERCLRVYSAPTPVHSPLYCITGLPDLPTCLAYSPCGVDGSSSLMVGTVRGAVCVLRFARPRVSLLQHAPDALVYCSWTELCSGAQRVYCTVRVQPAVHSRAVRRILCEQDARRMLSCSHDSQDSLRVRHASQHLDDYILKLQRGASCFHAVAALRLVAVGSADGVVRLWSPPQNVPFAKLTLAGAAPLLDIAILPRSEMVVAFHSNCVLNIWDLYEEYLLHSIKIKFPFLGVLGKKVEFGAYCIHPGDKLTRRASRAPDRPAHQIDPKDAADQSLDVTGRQDDRMIEDNEEDPEYIRFDRPEVLITCCDYVCRVVLDHRSDTGLILPPPGDTLKARRPSFWELPEDFVADSATTRSSERLEASSNSTQGTSSTQCNMQSLLEGAGLRGILEKDFVLMQGFKNDLNKKLFHMKSNMDARAAGRRGAPHLALETTSPTRISPPPRASHYREYERLLKLFPPPSIICTPTGSGSSTPRHSRTKL